MTEIVVPPVAPPKRSKTLWIVLGVLLAVILLVVGLWWWFNRPISPVVLSPAELTVVEAKVEALERPIQNDAVTDPNAATDPDVAPPTYEKGSKEIILTERELNGLLNQNTDLGKSLRFELVPNAVHARVEMDLDPDLPILGGKRLKARARFLVSDVPGEVSLKLDDLTVWGISLPNDWLGGLKGQDLLSKVLGQGEPIKGKVAGIEEFKIESGRLVIKLSE